MFESDGFSRVLRIYKTFSLSAFFWQICNFNAVMTSDIIQPYSFIEGIFVFVYFEKSSLVIFPFTTYVLTSFKSTWHKVLSYERRKPQLKMPTSD